MSQAASKSARHHASHKDTFDQIVLMLVLAFTFRVFAVEAFVIPTGSMAPTLMGAHARFTCDNCGYHYDVNYSGVSDRSGDINIPRRADGMNYAVNCPNCGFEQSTPVPNIYYGDRILVLKYAALFESPKRWDVVVFKSPDRPKEYHYSQAYIKRLIGLPGEQIMILDGDIYAATKPNATDRDWTVQQKPDVVQNALWRVINDIDFAPADGQVPWKPQGDAWRYSRDSSGARSLLFSNINDAQAVSFDPGVGADRKPLADFLAYDQHGPQRSLQPVGDLKLSLYYTRNAGDGPLELNLSKDRDLFTAVIEPSKVSLYRARIDAPKKKLLMATAPYFFASQPARLDFVNVDYRVRLLVDGKQVLTTTAPQYHPDVAAIRAREQQPLLSQVSITAAKQVCSLAHVSLWRDSYYTQSAADGRPIDRGGPDKPVTLGSTEYFCLGDNSPLSGDGRFWTAPVSLPAEGIQAQAGVVPERFMLGKALMVYWPAGYRPLSSGVPDLIPNMGEMRFIH